MRNLPRILIATAFSTLALSTLTLPAWAADAGDAVKTDRPPYKPGRAIDDAAQAAPASDDGAQPVETGRRPYKPGREANDEKDSDDNAKN